MNTLWLEGGWKSKSGGLGGAAKTWRLGKCRGLNYKYSARMQPSHHPILGWDANLSLWEILILIRFFLGYWLGVFWWFYTCRYKYTCLQFENINNFLFLSKRRCMIHVYFTSRKHNFFIVRRWNKDLTSAMVLFLFPYNLFCFHLFLGIKVYLFLGIFQLQRFGKMSVFMYSQTCIEQSPTGHRIPQNRVIIKNDKKAMLCHNWSFM